MRCISAHLPECGNPFSYRIHWHDWLTWIEWLSHKAICCAKPRRVHCHGSPDGASAFVTIAYCNFILLVGHETRCFGQSSCCFQHDGTLAQDARREFVEWDYERLAHQLHAACH